MNDGQIEKRFRPHWRGHPILHLSPHASCQALVRLAKVVYRQAEHVIGAHPCFINVLQDEALMKSHDGVVICLEKEQSQGQL